MCFPEDADEEEVLAPLEVAAVADLVPIAWVSDFHPAQSSSAMPSSMDTIGYFSTHFVQYAAISALLCADLSDFLNTYLPLALSKNSLDAGSSAMLTCSPGL